MNLKYNWHSSEQGQTGDRVPSPDSILYVKGEQGFREAYVAGFNIIRFRLFYAEGYFYGI